ncbi:hypothetical protein O0555_21655 [Brevibacillus laterosporus]|uniref:hypothetical protein n=1 Tax=Brevibacillus laterosporus TaxID=1465 RepID=UPI0018CFA99F|nr:hypothetical protein [Brevibacillus laterosporus]MBG9797125.1 hypothetical protein [Brevibacillus laterosporus]MCR8939911.1 hypothetical protein [Brevibacillus laterosporus]MCZ0842551.1 hypothetical protein [Brevibacillus laterosporus]MCZ0847565.1 hypothetical protein [Brevibacillus laterosporus]MED1909573.1 hypothetical protein [Brevibacillus laterosporus]
MIKVTPTMENKLYIDFDTGQEYPSGVNTSTQETPWVKAKLRLGDLRIVEDEIEGNSTEFSEPTTKDIHKDEMERFSKLSADEQKAELATLGIVDSGDNLSNSAKRLDAFQKHLQGTE